MLPSARLTARSSIALTSSLKASMNSCDDRIEPEPDASFAAALIWLVGTLTWAPPDFFLAGAFLAGAFFAAFLVAFLAAFLAGAFFVAFLAAFLAGAFFAAFLAVLFGGVTTVSLDLGWFRHRTGGVLQKLGIRTRNRKHSGTPTDRARPRADARGPAVDHDARVDALDAEQVRWLLDAGLGLVADAVAALDAGESELALGGRLRADGLDPDRAVLVMDVATARRLAREQRPDDPAGLVWTRAALEQASHPLVAAHRAARFADAPTVVDLACGSGADARAIAASGPSVLGVDRDEARVLLCRHNAAVAGLDVTVEVGDALAPPGPHDVPAHADPGRRPGGRRARTLAEHEPPVGDLVASLAGRPGAGIVLSPAVDLGDPDLPDGELEFVQVGSRLVEAVAWLGDRRSGPEVAATATVLVPGEDGDVVTHVRRRSGPADDVAVADVGAVLLEPAPALVRARLHGELAAELGARKVSDRRALLTLDDAPPPAAAPWVTAWQVEAVLPGRPRELRRWLSRAEPVPLSISLHGDRRPVEAWWAAAKGQPRGPVGRRLLVVDTERGALAVLGRPLRQG